MRSVFILAFVSVMILEAPAQSPGNFANEARLLKKALIENHVQPRKIDDKYSAWVFDHFIEELDPERTFFTEKDIAAITSLRTKIDDDLNGPEWNFLPQITQLYQKVLDRYSLTITEAAAQPTDFLKDESFKEDTIWCVDAASLKTKCKLSFWYNTLERVADLRERYPEKPEKDFLVAYEKPAREQVRKVMLREADRITHHVTGFENHVASEFFKALAAAFDPHTTYFSAQEVETFMSSLSSKGYYFGFTLGENEKGEVTITQLTPGGPAWKSGQVNTGDVLQTLHWQGQDPIDLWGVDLDEVNDMLLENDYTSLELTLRKSDGTSKTVALRKEKLESEQAIVKSFVLDGQKKIGYISLPDFYTDWGNEDGSQCANDVAREVIKLKNENIDGLILDLRFNGGGSMVEAVAMAGIFIDAGPVGIIKTRSGELISVKDMNRGTVYDGPLAIMVNGLSASASEFLAAALQDYNRAIIIGGNTYGKATAQRLTSTNSTAPVTQTKGNPAGNNIGVASITIEKLYRITGKTAQRTGVVPDVYLPDALEALPLREEDMPGAFMPDTIVKKMYYKTFAPLPVKELSEKSGQRVLKQPKFAELKKLSQHIAELGDMNQSIPLQWEKFKKMYADGESIVKRVEKNSDTDESVFKASRMKSEEQRMQMNGYVNEFNQTWIKNLQEDISLNEAFLIICDLIPYVTKK